MIARVVSKRNLQAMLKACRESGLLVETHPESMIKYRVNAGGIEVLTAMTGTGNYLVRMREDLFEQPDPMPVRAADLFE